MFILENNLNPRQSYWKLKFNCQAWPKLLTLIKNIQGYPIYCKQNNEKKDVANPKYLITHIRKIFFPPRNVFILSTHDGETESIVHVETKDFIFIFLGHLGSPTSLKIKSTKKCWIKMQLHCQWSLILWENSFKTIEYLHMIIETLKFEDSNLKNSINL
jgi:hypothetical protein